MRLAASVPFKVLLTKFTLERDTMFSTLEVIIQPLFRSKCPLANVAFEVLIHSYAWPLM